MAEGESGIWTPPGGSADPRRRPREDAEAATAGAEPTPEELLERFKRLQVSDVLLSAMSTVAQLAYTKLDEPTRDLEQARLAIESLRALVPVLQGAVPGDATRDFQQLVANLQLAYAQAAGRADAESRPEQEPRSRVG